jgi:hypothetical protein
MLTMMIRRFNRYELKYLLPVEQCDRIIVELKDSMDVDAHGGPEGYRLVSLYYDSPSLDCFWAKVDGLKFRRKLRVRIYPESDIETTQHGMVEIKQRTNRTVQKRRLDLPLPVAEGLCNGELGLADLGPLDALDSEVASEVQYLVDSLHLQPTAITAYRRKAFVGRSYDRGLRVTFDTDLRGRTHGLRVNASATNRLVAPLDWCVMEVKSDDAVPEWVCSMLARHGCQLRRVSKYCATLATISNLGLPSVVFPVMPGTVDTWTEHG